MKKVLIVIAILIAVIFGVIVAKSFITTLDKAKTAETSDTYMGLSREDYLNQVSNNGQDTASLCAYTYLIDRYGLKETYNMDYRAYKDENDVDERIFKAIEMCME